MKIGTFKKGKVKHSSVFKLEEKKLCEEGDKIALEWFEDFDESIKQGNYKEAEQIANKYQPMRIYKIVKKENSKPGYEISYDYKKYMWLSDISRDFYAEKTKAERCVGLGSLVGGVVGGVLKWRYVDAKNKELLSNSPEYKQEIQNFYDEKAQELNEKNYIEDYTFTSDDLIAQVREWYDKSYEKIVAHDRLFHYSTQTIVDPRYSDYYFDYRSTGGFGVSDTVEQISNDFIKEYGYSLQMADLAGSILLSMLATTLIASIPMIKFVSQSNSMKKQYALASAQFEFNKLIEENYGEAVIHPPEPEVRPSVVKDLL